MYRTWGYSVPPGTGASATLEPMHGTTTVGIKINEAVILAADKRATAGHLIASRRVKKIVKIDEKIAMTIAGVVADAQTLADSIRAEMKFYSITSKKTPTVKNYANLLSRILFSSKWFPYMVQLIVGGYDTAPRLFALDWYGSVLEEEKFTSTGSGSPIAYGVLEDGYRDDMSVEEAVELARKAVTAATRRDSASGDGVDVFIITNKGIEERTLKLG
ncbi:MAG: archaeal proteasome endopeptidase complex subunit beta [Desulfurococcales archaeon]|nr:archaeal proteasome endopeptidase complex subunit beta [Desulfurococcales archaeon]